MSRLAALTRIEAVDGLTQFAFDSAMSLGREDFPATDFADVKGVDGSAFFSGNLCRGDVDIQLAERL